MISVALVFTICFYLNSIHRPTSILIRRTSLSPLRYLDRNWMRRDRYSPKASSLIRSRQECEQIGNRDTAINACHRRPCASVDAELQAIPGAPAAQGAENAALLKKAASVNDSKKATRSAFSPAVRNNPSS